MPVIEAHNIVCQFAPGRGVCGVSLSIEPGQCYILLGRNGSGKTTFTKLLLGLSKCDSGKLTVLGCDLSAGTREHLTRCGVASDSAVHWDNLTGRANAYFVARSYGLSDQQITHRLDGLLAEADLLAQADEPVATYSFGMRRKLSIIQAVLHEPELLILDEPTAGLDAHFTANLAGMIAARSEKNLTTWLAGNDPDFAADVASHVAFMDAGKIITEGTPAQLIADLSDSQEVSIELQGKTALPRPDLPGLVSFVQDGEQLVSLLENDAHLVGKLIHWITDVGGRIHTVDVRRPRLRDAFITATGRRIDE